MKNKKLALLIILVIFLFGGFLAIRQKSEPKKSLPTSSSEVLSATDTLSSPTPSPSTISLESQLSHSTPKTIDCVGADGKHAFVAQSICDAVNTFWSNHKPPIASPSSSTSTSSNASGTNDSSIPTISISNVAILPCGVESCSWTKTIQVTGVNLTNNSKMKGILSNGTRVNETTTYFNTPDARVSGGDYFTTLITDFYNLPIAECANVSVRVVDRSQSVTGNTVYNPNGTCN